MNDRNGRFDTIYTGKPNNVKHVVNTVNSAQFGIENALHGNFSALCKFFSLFLANPAKERFKQQQHKLL